MKTTVSELKEEKTAGASFFMTHNGTKSSSYFLLGHKIAPTRNLRSIYISFLWLLLTKYHKLGCLSHSEIYSVTALELEV